MNKKIRIHKEDFSKSGKKIEKSIEFLREIHFDKAEKRNVNGRSKWVVEISARNLKGIIKKADEIASRAEARYNEAVELSASAYELKKTIQELRRKLANTRSENTKLRKRLKDSEERYKLLDENTRDMLDPKRHEKSPRNIYNDPDVINSRHVRGFRGGIPGLGKRR